MTFTVIITQILPKMLFFTNCAGVSRQRDVSTRLSASRPRLTSTSSRRSSLSNVGSNEDASLADGMKTTPNLSQHNCNTANARLSKSSSKSDVTDQPRCRTSAAQKQAEQKASSDTATDTPKKSESLHHDLKTLPPKINRDSSVPVTTIKFTTCKQLQLGSNSQSASGNDQVTIARHRPAVSSSTRQDTAGCTTEKDGNITRRVKTLQS